MASGRRDAYCIILIGLAFSVFPVLESGLAATAEECRARLAQFESTLGAFRLTFRRESSPSIESKAFTEALRQAWPVLVKNRIIGEGRPTPALPEVLMSPRIEERVVAADGRGKLSIRDRDGGDIYFLSDGTWKWLRKSGGYTSAAIASEESVRAWLAHSPLFGNIYLLPGQKKLAELLDEAAKSGAVAASPVTRSGRQMTLLEVRTGHPTKESSQRFSHFCRFYLDPDLSLSPAYVEYGRRIPRPRRADEQKSEAPVEWHDQVQCEAEFKNYRPVRPGVLLPWNIDMAEMTATYWPDPQKPPRDWEFRKYPRQNIRVEVLNFEQGLFPEEFPTGFPTGTTVQTPSGWSYVVRGLSRGPKDLAQRLVYDGPQR